VAHLTDQDSSGITNQAQTSDRRAPRLWRSRPRLKCNIRLHQLAERFIRPSQHCLIRFASPITTSQNRPQHTPAPGSPDCRTAAGKLQLSSGFSARGKRQHQADLPRASVKSSRWHYLMGLTLRSSKSLHAGEHRRAGDPESSPPGCQLEDQIAQQ